MKLVETTKHVDVSKSSTSQKCNSNLQMALSLLRVNGLVGAAARETFKTLIDTDKAPEPGKGLRLSLREEDKEEFIELLQLMRGSISNVIIRRASAPSWYADVLGTSLCNVRRLALDMSEADTQCAIEFRELKKIKRTGLRAEECGAMMDNILKAFDTITQLEVKVYQINRHYIQALTNHARKVQDMKVTFVHYEIWSAYTFANIGRTCGPSLKSLEVFGKLASRKTPSFLGLSTSSEVFLKCKVTFNGKPCE